MMVHMFLGCPEVKPGDELVEKIPLHAANGAAPEEVTCQRCITDNRDQVHHSGGYHIPPRRYG